MEKKRIVIIGAGFAGLNAARELAKLDVNVTLIDRRNHHTFQPLLYQVALSVLNPADIAEPIRSVFRGVQNVEVLLDEAVSFNLDQRTVMLGSGTELQYDYLVVATGATHSYFGKDEWASLAPGLKTIEDALVIRRRVLEAFELAEREMVEKGTHPQLTFVVIGGGPTGVELAGAISDIAKLYMRHDFRHIVPSQAKVMILEGSPNILGPYPDDLKQKAREQLGALKVEVHTSTTVTDIQPDRVIVKDSEGVSRSIEATVTLWAAGVQASPLGRKLGLPLNRRGQVTVDQFLNPEGYPELFVCGDLAHFEQDGRQVPGVAQPAMQMGTHVAKLINADLKNQPRKPFRYFDKGDMATIGRKAAIAKVVWPFRAHLSGVPAWLTWLLIHVAFLINFRSRLSVLRQWVHTYLFFKNGARLILGLQDTPNGGDPLAQNKANLNSKAMPAGD
ncbi:MAG: NAD(P)/FAD-dependent oxidoreductase [Acidobacteriaceae bacterium]|nr:NAD(P)/FAD-dependent oxidoreductase [Acidobacteriaceae bacterium]